MFAFQLTVLLLAIALTDAQSPSCSSNCVSNVTVEGQIILGCQLRYFGAKRPTLTWYNKLTNKELPNIPAQTKEGNITSRDFPLKTVTPSIAPLVCVARISNDIETRCETEPCYFLYSVRNVVTWPLLYASPGEKITCIAEGNPTPRFLWQAKNESKWEFIEGANTQEIKAPMIEEIPLYEIRCVARNNINGGNYQKESLAIAVSKHGAAIRTRIIIGVVVGVVILAIIAGLVYYFFC